MSLIYILVSCLLLCCASCSANLEVPELPFSIDYQWQFINFTWPSEEDYQTAIDTKTYIPENTAISGVKIYKEKIYFAIPRIRNGVPVTLGYISTEVSPKLNALITPFPTWEMNKQEDCSTLRNVQSMEIDQNGVMWILDGFRLNSNAGGCPPKLLLVDLNNNDEVLHVFTFPEEIGLSNGGFLNDLVVDEGSFAYIADAGSVDPGLIVYSREQDRAWKLRDSTMFPELDASDFVVNNLTLTALYPIDGIALSPKTEAGASRSVYYSALTGFSLYSIGTEILKNEEICRGGDWRREVVFIGKKQSQSDGLAMSNNGDLYYGMLPLYGVGKWNINQPFSTAEIVEENRETMVWTDSFGFDTEGNLYLLADNVNQFFDPSYPLVITEEYKFKLLKMFTGTKSYLY